MAEGAIRNWANAASFILDTIASNKVPEGVHLIDHFKDQYESIARILGSISELANILSFREGDKSYYSISATNFLYTMVKKFKEATGKDITELSSDDWEKIRKLIEEGYDSEITIAAYDSDLEDDELKNAIEELEAEKSRKANEALDVESAFTRTATKRKRK